MVDRCNTMLARRACAVDELFPVDAQILTERLEHDKRVLPDLFRVRQYGRQIPTDTVAVRVYRQVVGGYASLHKRHEIGTRTLRYRADILRTFEKSDGRGAQNPCDRHERSQGNISCDFVVVSLNVVVPGLVQTDSSRYVLGFQARSNACDANVFRRRSHASPDGAG